MPAFELMVEHSFAHPNPTIHNFLLHFCCDFNLSICCTKEDG
ncbi:MAG: hypothetical protein RR747_05780 [Gordonibacter sp.]